MSLQSRILKRVKNLYVDFGDYRRTVFLAGSGRSGTTWVENIINHDNGYRIMFEPFHSRKVPLVSQWNYRQYIRPGNRAEKFLQPATAILSGSIRNAWIDKFNRRKLVTRRIVKDIRANFFLRWIKENFPQIPIVLLLRHPCAVADSKIRLGWETHLENCLEQADLMQDHLRPFQQKIQATEDLFEKHIFMWCIENYVPLRQFAEGEIKVVFYEDLCVQPDQTSKELLEWVGARYSPDIMDIIRTPSAASQQDSAIKLGKDLISSWQNHITDRQRAQADEILSLFGMQHIYGADSMPRIDGTEALSLLKKQV